MSCLDVDNLGQNGLRDARVGESIADAITVRSDRNANLLLVRDANGEVAPGGHLLGSAHTLRHYQDAFYEPKLSDSENVESLVDGGSKHMHMREFDRWNEMLNAYTEPPMDIAKHNALTANAVKRKEEMPDA